MGAEAPFEHLDRRAVSHPVGEVQGDRGRVQQCPVEIERDDRVGDGLWSSRNGAAVGDQDRLNQVGQCGQRGIGRAHNFGSGGDLVEASRRELPDIDRHVPKQVSFE
jgi:hypothetical protein